MRNRAQPNIKKQFLTFYTPVVHAYMRERVWKRASQAAAEPESGFSNESIRNATSLLCCLGHYSASEMHPAAIRHLLSLDAAVHAF